DRVGQAARAVAGLDLYAALAETTAQGAWVRPRLSSSPRLAIREGRHPLVESLRRQEPFTPNDCDLSPEKRILVVTGPNMGGKSTYLRQVATAVLLAQAGSFVPAASMEASVVDRIFTRVGAGDHLARGESPLIVRVHRGPAI